MPVDVTTMSPSYYEAVERGIRNMMKPGCVRLPPHRLQRGNIVIQCDGYYHEGQGLGWAIHKGTWEPREAVECLDEDRKKALLASLPEFLHKFVCPD